MKLSNKDAAAALREGWFLSNDEAGRIELQRDDEAGKFSSDEDAFAAVYTKASKGSKMHVRAIEQYRSANPSGYAIMLGCDVGVRACPCGDSTLRVIEMRLELRGVPVTFTDDGPQYDDTVAEYSEGWDYNEDSAGVECRACKRVFSVMHDDDDNYLTEREAR